jgi:hypothetical protein
MATTTLAGRSVSRLCEYEHVPRLVPRVGPFGVALALYQTWLRLPPRHRAHLMRLAAEHGGRIAVKHGPRVAATVIRARQRTKP